MKDSCLYIIIGSIFVRIHACLLMLTPSVKMAEIQSTDWLGQVFSYVEASQNLDFTMQYMTCCVFILELAFKISITIIETIINLMYALLYNQCTGKTLTVKQTGFSSDNAVSYSGLPVENYIKLISQSACLLIQKNLVASNNY